MKPLMVQKLSVLNNVDNVNSKVHLSIEKIAEKFAIL